MANLAWATYIVEVNYQAILSEVGSSFNRDFLEAWVKENGEGYFLRDPESPLDCCLIRIKEFSQLYRFRYHDEGFVFRLVEAL